MRKHELLSEAEREQLLGIPIDRGLATGSASATCIADPGLRSTSWRFRAAARACWRWARSGSTALARARTEARVDVAVNITHCGLASVSVPRSQHQIPPTGVARKLSSS